MKLSKRSALIAVAGTLVVSLGVGVGLAVGESQTSALKPVYAAAQVEKEDPNRQYRAMPSLQHVSWTDGGGDHRRFIRSFLVSPDGQNPVKSRVEYQDANSVWHPALDARTKKPLMQSADAQNVSVNNVFKNSGGDLVAVELRAHNDSSGRYFYQWTSGDGGKSWKPSRSKLDMNGGAILPGAAGQSFQRVITLPDGNRVVPYYAAHKGVKGSDGKYKQTWSAAHLLVGGKDGSSWKRTATVFKSDSNTYSESSVTRRADKKLLMISRYEVVKNGLTYSKLSYRVTTSAVNSAADLAKAKWTGAKAVVVPGATDKTVVRGVAPVVHTMSGGVLMLVFGRPGNKIAFSYDGGVSWTATHDFYRNIPTNCGTGYKGHPCSDLGSSGYMGVAVTSPTSAYIMGDNCQSGWGCGGKYSYPHGTTDRLWLSLVRLK
ncbi:sialidase family protein [Stackebrandtia nassauensis]|uniref:Exo-alpha-sialidase n=1 Tax=Stackebrandtia nassauensis (strain DSM 44728 / CIP 108903 / NRRL B-16338 / NBRC 102104 / LLR-40K-21) TaxID=446470 RepID=D3Q8W9_STANL|nr:sialidase family protein [Stackebrandtia nassauensis]ADD40578.1 hypothetical protein Snas_0867 [Stackebrandtia nassauensis DSM 44728]